MVSENGYRVTGFSNVFAIGNAVTGKGNIQDSKSHGSSMTNKIIDEHLQSDDLLEEWLQNINTNLKNKVNEQIDVIDQAIQAQKIMPDHLIENILNRTKELQQKTGFTTYKEWIALKTPIRLEDMLAKKVDK
jgi:hypothetical protein